METQLSDLVRAAAITNGNIVSGIPFMIIGKNKFEVAPTRLPDFIGGYCKLAYEDSNNESEGVGDTYGLNLAEVICAPKLPLMINMQLKFNLEAENREYPNLYDDSFLVDTVSCIQNLQLDLLHINPNMSDLICLVMESSSWTTNNATSIMIKFHFPFCQIDRNYYSKTFRPCLIQELRKVKVINHLEYQPIGDWDNIIIEYTDSVPMFRSKGLDGQPPLQVSKIYGQIRDDIEIDDIKELQLKDIFEPRNHSWIHLNAIPATFLAKNVELEYWYPLLLSISFWPSITHPKSLDNIESVSNNPIEYDASVKDKDPKIMISYLLPLLSINRIVVEPYWIDVGKVLHKVYNGSQEGLRIWTTWSAKGLVPNRSQDTCVNKWLSFQNITLSEKTIGWYAREDDKNGYDEWHNAWSKDALLEATSTVNSDVAEALYRVFWLDYLCSKCDKNGWYKFDGMRLKQLDDAVDLRKDISKIFIPIYKKLRTFYSDKSNQGGLAEGDKKLCETNISLITTLIKKLGSHAYETTIIKSAQKSFYEEDFDKKKDTDPSKTAWLNCVVEICNGHAYKRSGKPEDFLTMSTFLSIRDDLHWQHPLVVELMEWLSQVFPDEELRHFFLKDVASFMFGKNAEKLFRIWSGEGDNSKSMINKLFQAVLGMYNIDFPIELLSGKKMHSSGPTPELAQTRGAHVGMLCEPESDQELKSGAVKRYTGGDRMFARALHENGGSVIAMFKMIFMCNRIPKFLSADKALMNRVMIIPFLSTWSMNAPKDKAEQYRTRTFQMDPFFESRIPDLAYAMAWIMIQYYPIYSNEGLKVPKIVKEHTDKYWEDNDFYKIFIFERLEQAYLEPGVINKNESLTASELYGPFSQWFRANYPGIQIPTSATFKLDMSMSNRLGEQYNRRWLGIKLRNIEIPISKIS